MGKIPQAVLAGDDTGLCVPESTATLLHQQRQLEAGGRDVQMFPRGTPELPLPAGLRRHKNNRGAFHYRDGKISAARIDDLSAAGRENEFLNLGPYCKPEIIARVLAGERLVAVSEYTPAGVELRCAVGTDRTAAQQREYFDQTKEPNNLITVGALPERVQARFAEAR